MSQTTLQLDRLAIGLSLAGVILGVLTAVLGRLIGEDLSMHGYAIFAGLSVAAIVLGIVTRTSPLGKTAAITSSVLLVGSLAFLV